MPSVFFDSGTYAKRGVCGGGVCGGGGGSAGGKPPDYIKACRAAAASDLALTIAAFSLRLQDILRLI